MRHGRPFLVKDHHHDGASQLGDILATITKTLSTSGTRNLPDPHTVPLSEPILFQILRAQSLHPSKKLDFFKWCSLTHNIKHSARTYSHILRTASRSGFLHEVPQLLHSMKEDGIVVDSQTFKTLLDAFIIRSGKFDYALEILEIMQDVGAGLNTDMYNSVLVALVRKYQVGLAMAILFELLGGGDSTQVLCLVGKVNDALTVWEELKGSGHEPDAITYRILIQVCCKCYRIDDATKIFSEMQLNGYIPDTIVYNSLLDGLFKARKVNDGCKLLEKIVQNGVRASMWMYNILRDGLFRNGWAEAAYTLFCDLK